MSQGADWPASCRCCDQCVVILIPGQITEYRCLAACASRSDLFWFVSCENLPEKSIAVINRRDNQVKPVSDAPENKDAFADLFLSQILVTRSLWESPGCHLFDFGFFLLSVDAGEFIEIYCFLFIPFGTLVWDTKPFNSTAIQHLSEKRDIKIMLFFLFCRFETPRTQR